MRVLVITNMYPPHHYGGYELLCQEMVDGFRSAGHEVLVLTSDISVAGVEHHPEPRTLVRRDLRLYWRDHVMLRPSRRESLSIERANQRALTDAIDSFQPTVVSLGHMGALSIGLLRSCQRRQLPMVGVINDDWLVYAPRVDRWANTWRRTGPLAAVAERVFRVPCRVPDLGAIATYCFISETTLQTAVHAGGWTLRDATVGYSGINIVDFPVGVRAPRDTWSWKLLYVGRIDERKGIHTAIRALPHLPTECTLDIVGRGDDRHLEALHALAAELGVADRVAFGHEERSKLADRYASADALVFPPSWSEPFGLVPLEAMACSTPVVATGTGGTGEFLVDEANCLLVPIDDHEAIAAAVRRLADDAALRTQLVRGGIVTAQELTMPRWVQLLERWHVAASSGPATPRPAHRESIRDVLQRELSATSG